MKYSNRLTKYIYNKCYIVFVHCTFTLYIPAEYTFVLSGQCSGHDSILSSRYHKNKNSRYLKLGKFLIVSMLIKKYFTALLFFVSSS